MASLRIIVVCAFVAAFASAQAQIVECLDANGKKIYSQTCPNGAQQKREIEQEATPKPDAKNEQAKSDAARRALEIQEKGFEKRRQDRINAEAKEAQQQRESAAAAQQCANAKSRLDLLNSGRQFRRADPVTGEHVPMDENQRQTEIDRLNAQIQATCQ